jgi:hypothetical protein
MVFVLDKIYIYIQIIQIRRDLIYWPHNIGAHKKPLQTDDNSLGVGTFYESRNLLKLVGPSYFPQCNHHHISSRAGYCALWILGFALLPIQ